MTPRAIEDFFVRYARSHGMASRRSMQAAMRLFLRFCACHGWVPVPLVGAVPSLRTYRLSDLPRGVSEADVRRLVRSMRSASARDRAVVTLLACYGVRRGQISMLEPADIDWSARTITFRGHKGGKAITHSLVPAVAEPLAQYLRHDRPQCESSRVFVRMRRPHLGLSPTAVTMLVRDRLLHLGVRDVPRGPHALRHAFAMRLLAARQPIKAIADLLGHRTLSATSVYAKVDLATLRAVASDWPEVRS